MDSFKVTIKGNDSATADGDGTVSGNISYELHKKNL